MEKFQPMAMSLAHPNVLPNMQPNMQAPVMQAPIMSAPTYPTTMPINVSASYEQINLYEKPKYHHPHHHCYPHYGGWGSAGIVLVLYILLVIILRTGHRF